MPVKWYNLWCKFLRFVDSAAFDISHCTSELPEWLLNKFQGLCTPMQNIALENIMKFCGGFHLFISMQPNEPLVS